MRKHLILSALPLALLAACSRSPEPAPAPTGSEPPVAQEGAQTALGRQAESALAKAREELRTNNITIGRRYHLLGAERAGEALPAGQPKGEITPAGDLLVDGAQVPVDAAQRALLLQYREHVIGIVDAGMAMGVQGTDLGVQAAGDAIRGLLGGDAGQVRDTVRERAAGMREQAAAMCDRLVSLHATQNQLASSLPAFKPYARLQQVDIDNCRADAGGLAGQARQRVQEGIRENVREGIRGVLRSESEAPPADSAPAP